MVISIPACHGTVTFFLCGWFSRCVIQRTIPASLPTAASWRCDVPQLSCRFIVLILYNNKKCIIAWSHNVTCEIAAHASAQIQTNTFTKPKKTSVRETDGIFTLWVIREVILLMLRHSLDTAYFKPPIFETVHLLWRACNPSHWPIRSPWFISTWNAGLLKG